MNVQFYRYTRSFDGMMPPGYDDRWAPFDDLHAFLEASFPTLYLTANVTAINTYSLVFIPNGTSPDLKHMMIAGHQDVVPATTSLDRWTFPPFSGTVDDVWIYGRGSGDCKNTVIGSMIAVEHLLQQNWKPARTLRGIVMIVDEGGSGVDGTQFDRTFALPGVVEKGSVNFKAEVDGHASIPSDYTTIGVLSEIIETFENSHVFQPHLEETSPIWAYLQCVEQFGNASQVPSWVTQDVGSTTPNFQNAANNLANISLNNRYLIQTSHASIIFEAGIKSNELAESAARTFNVRIEIFSNVTAVQDVFLSFVNPIAEKYPLTVNGTSLSGQPSIGNIMVFWGNPHDPTPTSPFSTNTTAWKYAQLFEFVSHTYAQCWQGCSPFIALLRTKNIYRWSPVRVGERLNTHTVDEKISIRTYLEGLKFYAELILRMDSLASHEGI
ncbi:Carboxypeptidase S [Leucoagaricus sp. SymC.cos]|nr:Carboxypeptidase S [Leucoagaricus sp. SymC.cos]